MTCYILQGIVKAAAVTQSSLINSLICFPRL